MLLPFLQAPPMCAAKTCKVQFAGDVTPLLQLCLLMRLHTGATVKQKTWSMQD